MKALRESNACTMEQANAVLEKCLLKEFNERYAVTPADTTDAHRPCPAKATLDATLCAQRKRTVANDYTVRHDKKLYQLLPPALPGLRGGTVIVEERTGGDVRLRFKDRYLNWAPASRASASG